MQTILVIQELAYGLPEHTSKFGVVKVKVLKYILDLAV